MTVTAVMDSWRAWGASAASAALIAWASWEYVADVARRRADPRLATWIIWTASMYIGAVGAWTQGATAAAWLGVAGGASCLAVLVTGFVHGTTDTGWLDTAGAACGGAGLVLLGGAAWRPELLPMWAAIAASVGTDIAAFAPTMLNAWRGEETAAPYVKFGLAAAVTITAADGSAASLIFPVYETAACALAAWLAWAAARRQRDAYGEGTGQAVREIMARSAWPGADGELLRPLSGPVPPLAEEERQHAIGAAVGLLGEELVVHH